MYILAIETTGAFASVALIEDDRIIAHVSGNDRFSHLQNLMPQVDAVIKESKLSLGDVNGIAVSCGPGSFTGIRIGVSSARALSQVLGIPCIPVSSLAALAMRAAEIDSCKGTLSMAEASPNGVCKGTGQRSDVEIVSFAAASLPDSAGKVLERGESAQGAMAEDSPGSTSQNWNSVVSVQDADDAGNACRSLLICPMLDARRNQVYAGGYFLQDGYPVEEIKAGPYLLDEFLSKVAGYHRILLLGDAVDRYGEKIGDLRPDGTETTPESIRYQDAAAVAKLGLKIFREKGGLGYNELKPDYMRLAEAERKLRERQTLQKP